MLGVECADYVNWARECYHRRLTMVAARNAIANVLDTMSLAQMRELGALDAQVLTYDI